MLRARLRRQPKIVLYVKMQTDVQFRFHSASLEIGVTKEPFLFIFEATYFIGR